MWTLIHRLCKDHDSSHDNPRRKLGFFLRSPIFWWYLQGVGVTYYFKEWSRNFTPTWSFGSLVNDFFGRRGRGVTCFNQDTFSVTQIFLSLMLFLIL